MPDHDPLAEAGKRLRTPMAVYLVAGPRMTIMPGLTAIPCSEVELLAIEEQAVAAERARVKAAAMTLDGIRARHVEVKWPPRVPNVPWCTGCQQPWPCDTATVLAALDEWREVNEVHLIEAELRIHESEAALRAAEAREARLRAAISDFIIWWDMPPFLTDDARLSEEVAALRAALSPEPKP